LCGFCIFENMKKVSAISLLLLFISFCAFAQDMSAESQNAVKKFIGYVKAGNKEGLAGITTYPIKREYPIPAINNKKEFISRYKELFSDSLVKVITKSSPATDWSEMGWRGIMLLDGAIWLDQDGNLIGVNTQSPFERKEKAALIAEEKKHLHESLRNFLQPTCIIETSKYRIRIDEISSGKYRYASWPLKNKMSDKPDLVVENGEIVADGSGGNYHFQFKKDGYQYVCDIVEMGEDDAPPADLIVYKGEKEILYQKANKLIN